MTQINDILLAIKPARIKLLGDSITHGVGGSGFKQNGYAFIHRFARNPEGHCWANSFKKYVENKYKCKVVNNACTGTGIDFIINNFDILVDDEDDLIICTIGTNNRHFYHWSGDKPTREAFGEKFYKSVEKLYEMMNNAEKKVIFIANIPASASDEEDGEVYWRILHMNDIDSIYKAAAKKLGFAFISLYDLFNQYCDENGITVDSLLADGLHPNDNGYDVICELLIKELNL